MLHDRFELHYQPLFEMSERRLLGFEALIRLPAEDGTLIPPLVFIPVAEDCGSSTKSAHGCCGRRVAPPPLGRRT